MTAQCGPRGKPEILLLTIDKIYGCNKQGWIRSINPRQYNPKTTNPCLYEEETLFHLGHIDQLQNQTHDSAPELMKVLEVNFHSVNQCRQRVKNGIPR